MWILAYIGPGPGLVVQAPILLLLVGVFLTLLALLALPFRWLFRRPKKPGNAKLNSLVLLGLDGLEPTLVEEFMEAGQLPNFQSLVESGTYERLATCSPPLSPVAWSTFSTGVNPGKHGIFDFVRRGPNYQLALSSSEVSRTGTPRFLRKSRSFWTVLSEYGVFSQILRVPISWPPEKFRGTLLSAMAAPDLLGSQGSYTLFSTEPEELTQGHHCRLEGTKDGFFGLLSGPKGDKLRFDFVDGQVSVQGQSFELSQETYTPWIELKFRKAYGIAKFLKLDESRFYMTPIQISPSKPNVAISYPSLFATSLSSILGPFATCGLAEDMGARDDGVLSLEQFWEQCQEIHQERERQFFHILDRSPRGLCAAVFDGPDRMQHMTCDKGRLLELYQQMDALVGKTKERLTEGQELMVLSDHGFKPLRRLFDANAWLKKEGYLHYDGTSIDWSKTRAYCLGLSGMSVNLKGREREGLVSAEELLELKKEIKEKLMLLKDGEAAVFHSVHDANECYEGPYIEGAPDLILGFQLGYGIKKAAARGQVGGEILTDNDKPWVADHCFGAELVPGVLFSSLSLDEGARLQDVAPTVLSLFGVPVPSYMDGRSLVS